MTEPTTEAGKRQRSHHRDNRRCIDSGTRIYGRYCRPGGTVWCGNCGYWVPVARRPWGDPQWQMTTDSYVEHRMDGRPIP